MSFKTILLAISKTAISLWESLTFLYITWSVILAILAEVIQKYLFKDWNYLGFLAVPFLLDWFFGAWAAVKRGNFAFERIYDVIAKVFVYSGILMLGHVLSYFPIAGKEAGYPVLGATFYTILIMYESHSALKNMGVVYPNAGVIQWAEQKLGEIIKSKQQSVNADGKAQ